MRALVPRSIWAQTHADHKIGDPTHGTAAVLRYTADKGTCLVPVDLVDGPLFPLGTILVTAEAGYRLGWIDRHGWRTHIDPTTVLADHQAGRWGDLTTEEHEANDHAVRHGGPLRSVHWTAAGRIVLTTEAGRHTTRIVALDTY